MSEDRREPTPTDVAERTLADHSTGESAAPIAGDVVGRYLLRDKVGRGSFGTVWKAYDPELDRTVAVKLAHGADSWTPPRRAKWIREAQAMAALDHPSVATVFDVGVFERPGGRARVYIAMEYVDGETLRDWLTARARTRSAIVKVLIGAGRGLQAAHDAGIVHRDFKPANVLVDASDRAVVVDFGLARFADPTGAPEASASELTGSDASTRDSVGTPAYMAPEQFMASPSVDARSDQFAFAVTAWEALCGARPFAGGSQAVLAHNVVTGQILTAGAAHLPRRLRRALHRALSAEPGARFATVGALLEAFERRPRRDWLLGCLGVGVLGVAAAAVIRAPDSDDDRCTASARVREVWNPSRRGALLEASAPEGGVGSGEIVGEILDRLDANARAWEQEYAAACVDSDHRQGDVRLSCLRRQLESLDGLATALAEHDPQWLSNAASAADELPRPTRCRSIDPRVHGDPGDDDPRRLAEVEAIRLVIARANGLRLGGRYEPALGLLSPLPERATAGGLSWLESEVWLALGVAHEGAGELEAAAEALRSAYFTALQDRRDEVAARAAGRLAGLETRAGRQETSQRWTREARAALDRSQSDPSARAEVLTLLGEVAIERRDLELADLLLNEALSVAGPAAEGSARSAACHLALGKLRFLQARLPEARDHEERALRYYQQQGGASTPDAIAATINLGNVAFKLGEYARAEAHYEEALAGLTAIHGGDHGRLAAVHNNLGNALIAQGLRSEAGAAYRRGLQLTEKHLGPEHPSAAGYRMNLGNIALTDGAYEEAEHEYRRALLIVESSHGRESPRNLQVLTMLSAAHEKQRDLKRAREVAERALAIAREAHGDRSADTAGPMMQLGSICRGALDRACATSWYEQAVAIIVESLGPDSPRLFVPLTALAQIDLERGRLLAARGTIERAFALPAVPRDNPMTIAEAEFALAQALWPDPDQRARALTLAHRARAVFETTTDPEVAAMLDALDAWTATHR